MLLLNYKQLMRRTTMALRIKHNDDIRLSSWVNDYATVPLLHLIISGVLN